jgi:hypothetical protein
MEEKREIEEFMSKMTAKLSKKGRFYPQDVVNAPLTMIGNSNGQFLRFS